MINLSLPTMRKLVKVTSKLFLNSKCPLWLQRKGLDLMGGLSPLPKGVQLDKCTLANLSVWWFKPESSDNRQVIIYFHGGGYGVGSAQSHKDLCAYLCKYASLTVLSVNYRLAPEHPYPAAIEDAFAIYNALLKQGFESKDLVFAGDSAGGDLALTLALRCKENHCEQPALIFLISPWINKTSVSASHITQLDIDPVISESWSLQMANNYFNHSKASQSKACLSEADLTGLAPLLIHVGTDEVLLDDSLLLKQKCIKYSVPVKLLTFPELWHVFHFSPSLFKPAREALKQAGSDISLLL